MRYTFQTKGRLAFSVMNSHTGGNVRVMRNGDVIETLGQRVSKSYLWVLDAGDVLQFAETETAMIQIDNWVFQEYKEDDCDDCKAGNHITMDVASYDNFVADGWVLS